MISQCPLLFYSWRVLLPFVKHFQSQRRIQQFSMGHDMIIATSNKVSHLMKSERILLTLEMHCWFLYSRVFGELDYKAAVFLWHFCDLLVIFFGELELMVVGAIFWLNLVQKEAAVRNVMKAAIASSEKSISYLWEI